MQTMWMINVFFYWPNLRNIDVSLLLRRWSLMMLCIEVFETLIISMELFLIFIVFVMLTSESLMFQCFFIDDSLMNLWRTIEVTVKISLQALLTFKGFIDLISETLMFHWCFVHDSLMSLWRDIIETLITSIGSFWSLLTLLCLLLNPWCFIASSLMIRWWLLEETLTTLRRFRYKK